MPHVKVGPSELYYEIRGEAGPPVLYLLGLGSFAVSPNEYRLEDLLAREARVLLMDTRGLARSAPHPAGEYSIEGFADDAAALMDHAGWPEAHLVGTSMGGMIAQAFAYRHPERIRTLALMATAPSGTDGLAPDDETLAILENRDGLPAAEAGRRAWTTSNTTEFIEHHRDYLEWREGEKAKYPVNREVYRQHLAALRAFDSRPWLGELRCPTLVAWGEADRIIPARNSQRLAESLPHAERLAFPGLGHGFPTEARAELAAALRGLWARLPSGAPVGEQA